MNNFIKQVIEETFKSKKQQRLFYAKSQDKSLSSKERKKWASMAKEFSSKTDFEELPEKKAKKKEVDEVVDDNGNISRNKKPTNFNTKGITSNSTSDEAVRTGHGNMGTYGTTGVQNYRRYWGESDMSNMLGFDKTMKVDADYDDAEDIFKDDLGLTDDSEVEDRMAQMGYDKKLPKDKVRLVENPKKFVEDYIESIIYTKSNLNDIVQKQENEDDSEEKEISPIILKQINSLKNSMDSHKLSINDIVKHLKK